MKQLATIVLLVLLWPATATALEFGGSFKSLDVYRTAPPLPGLDAGGFSSNRLRLEAGRPLAAGHRFDAALDGRWLWTDPAGIPPLPDPRPNRRLDLEKSWGRGEASAQQLLVDRLQLHLVFDRTELDLGRQPIGFGRIVIFSPLDVIAPFAPDALDTDVRPGVDAVRLNRYFGLAGHLGATAVFGPESEDNSYLASFSENWGGIDLLALAGSLRDRAMGGLGLAGNLGGLGLKAEAAVYDGKRVGVPGGDLHDTFAIAAVEGWFRLENGLVLLGQYLYNGPGSRKPADSLQVAASAPLREGLTFLTGRHYLLLAPSYELHPLASLQGLAIWNLGDDSCLLRPLLDLSLADNLALQLFWNVNLGQKPQPTFPLPTPRSEFGSLGDSGGLFFSWYF